MKTDELIGLLARGAGAAPQGVVARRLGTAMALELVAPVVLLGARAGDLDQSRHDEPSVPHTSGA